ncbi:hypothetical protein M427DRAFT_52701 [Gonapodya prolifera JEL478]|uniref:SH3 domain-containing protein n=1 Tax=Gonapodya prolifera (strain JEL478) TaxID=1344416 RepID=A0A139ATN5_GONPJ|nr:hypothetical protein M427DRAFT_52701 [Gonapodya prolifera JEL478]|eukprot:KXS19855.1 hypothetical protein M427DRAFT_52701 [Gonapodya prolifera JEL478]
MNEDANRRLIEGVEWGSVSAVRRAIEDGADVAARKKITLKVTLGSTKETDSVWAESVLGLAIRSGRPDVVKVLLEAGCDANSRIRWKLSWYHSKWDAKKWEHQRWLEDEAYKYRSALEFALNCGRWDFNKMGADVVLSNPVDWDAVCDRFTLIPSIEIVQLLLQHGARVSEGELQAARELAKGANRWGDSFPPEPAFLELLEAHLQDHQQDRASSLTSSSGGESTSAPNAMGNANGHQTPRQNQMALPESDPQPVRSRTLTRTQAHLAQSRRTSTSPVSPILAVFDTSDMTRALAEQASTIDSQRRLIDEMQRRANDLERIVMERNARIADIEREKLVLEMDVFALRTEFVKFSRGERTMADRSAAAAAGMHSDPASPVQVRKVLYAHHFYEPRESDEIGLAPGDPVWCLYELSDGWGAGTNKASIQSGFFPMTYLSDLPASKFEPLSSPVAASSHLPTPRIPSRTMSAGLAAFGTNSMSFSGPGLHSPISNVSGDSHLPPPAREARAVYPGLRNKSREPKIGLIGASDDDDSSLYPSSPESETEQLLPEMQINGEVVAI